MTWNDRIVSTIRTAVPALVGAILTWLVGQVPAVGNIVAWVNATLSVDVTALLAAAAVAGLTAGYYALVRWAAQRWPWVEVLLGSKKTPALYRTSTASKSVTDASSDVATIREGFVYLRGIVHDGDQLPHPAAAVYFSEGLSIGTDGVAHVLDPEGFEALGHAYALA